MTERWLPIAGYEATYEISDLGRVRNVHTGRMLACTPNKGHGYPTVGLFRPKAAGGPKTYRVHRLVALAFLPNPEGLPEVNHKDLQRANNAVTNLEWSSSKHNMVHSMIAGRQTALTNPNKRYKLTPEAVADIRASFVKGVNQAQPGNTRELMAKYNIGRITVRRIVHGEAWYDPSLGIPAPPKPRRRKWRPSKRAAERNQQGRRLKAERDEVSSEGEA